MGKGTLYQPLFHRFCMNVEIDYSSHAMQHLHSWTLSVTNSLFPLSWVVFQAQLYCLLFCFASGMYFCFWYNSFSGYNQCNALWILKDCSDKISLNTITCSVWHSCFIIKRGIINCFLAKLHVWFLMLWSSMFKQFQVGLRTLQLVCHLVKFLSKTSM